MSKYFQKRKKFHKWIAVSLALIVLMPMQYSIAELSPERVEFYKERTAEWENALGHYAQWSYDSRALFCKIYGRIPGDYLNDEGYQEDIPVFPQNDCLSYEDALHITKEFLCDFDPRITTEYLNTLHVGSAFYDFWGDPNSTITGTSHVQVWIYQFGEILNDDDYIVRCTAYIEAITGRVTCVDLGIDMLNSTDMSHYTTYLFP